MKEKDENGVSDDDDDDDDDEDQDHAADSNDEDGDDDEGDDGPRKRKVATKPSKPQPLRYHTLSVTTTPTASFIRSCFGVSFSSKASTRFGSSANQDEDVVKDFSFNDLDA